MVGSQPNKSRRPLGLGSRLGLAEMTLALVLSASVSASEMESFIDRMPRAYSGEFRWGDDQPAQTIAMTFESVRSLGDQKAEALGCAAFEIRHQITKMKVRMFIRLSDLRVEIFEQSPQGDTRIEVDG
jgi:hypothetical protein